MHGGMRDCLICVKHFWLVRHRVHSLLPSFRT